MKYKIYETRIDENSGEFWRELVCRKIDATDEQDARNRFIDGEGAGNKGYCDYRFLRVYPVGTRVKLRGSVTNGLREKLFVERNK